MDPDSLLAEPSEPSAPLHSRIDAVFGALDRAAVGLPGSATVWRLGQPAARFQPGKDIASYSSDEDAPEPEPRSAVEQLGGHRRGGSVNVPVAGLGGAGGSRRKRGRRPSCNEDDSDDAAGDEEPEDSGSEDEEAAGVRAAEGLRAAFGGGEEGACQVSSAMRRAFEEEAEEDAFDTFAVATMRPDFAAKDRQSRQTAGVVEVLPGNAFDRLCDLRTRPTTAQTGGAEPAGDGMDMDHVVGHRGGGTAGPAEAAPCVGTPGGPTEGGGQRFSASAWSDWSALTQNWRAPDAAAAAAAATAAAASPAVACSGNGLVVGSHTAAGRQVPAPSAGRAAAGGGGGGGRQSVDGQSQPPRRRGGAVVPGHVLHPERYTRYTFDEPVEVGAGVRGGASARAAEELRQAAASALQAAAAAAGMADGAASMEEDAAAEDPVRAETRFGAGIEFRPRAGGASTGPATAAAGGTSAGRAAAAAALVASAAAQDFEGGDSGNGGSEEAGGTAAGQTGAAGVAAVPGGRPAGRVRQYRGKPAGGVADGTE